MPYSTSCQVDRDDSLILPLMIAKLLGALRVFVQSLIGLEPGSDYPEPLPVVPSIAERFGLPFPPPRLEISAPAAPDDLARRLKTALGEPYVEATPLDLAAAQQSGGVSVRMRLTGRYRLSGLLQRQILRGGLVRDGGRTRVTLFLTPRGGNLGAGPLASSITFAAFVCFVFLTWITGPAEISWALLAAVSIVIGVAAGSLVQGMLNRRANLKERRRLSRTGVRLAKLLDGTVDAWP